MERTRAAALADRVHVVQAEVVIIEDAAEQARVKAQEPQDVLQAAAALERAEAERASRSRWQRLREALRRQRPISPSSGAIA